MTRKEARRLAMRYAGELLVAQDWPQWADNNGIDIDDANVGMAFMDELKRLGYQLIERAENKARAKATTPTPGEA